ncbi:MAG: ATP-binding protein [Clostridia bacterium]|jgi:hypothetical protein
MNRNAINDLIRWKSSKGRKPLIIRGARQVGKTWLMKEFGNKQYEKCAYINFDNNDRMQKLFDGNIDIGKIITAFQIETGVQIEAENTLIIFDEIQEVPRALTSLKYFCENAPQFHVIAAGSLLGVALHPGTSFPVGKVDYLDLYPFNFLEFMNSTGNENLVRLLTDHEFELISSFREKYIDLLKQYYYVGGMPEAISTFIETSDYSRVREIQKSLLDAYEQDFSKHAPNETVPRIRMLWNSIPAQISKENKKFVYGLIKQGARAREYELAMQWLLDCGLIYKVSRIKKPDMPLIAYEDRSAFKLFVLDVGLLGAISGLDLNVLLEGNRLFREFKGSLTEQFVLQQMIAGQGIKPFYWSSDKGIAEIDFVFQNKEEIVPVEVKAAENLQSKSLKNYYQKYQPKISVRTSMSDYRKEDWIVNIPLYAINEILNII